MVGIDELEVVAVLFGPRVWFVIVVVLSVVSVKDVVAFVPVRFSSSSTSPSSSVKCSGKRTLS